MHRTRQSTKPLMWLATLTLTSVLVAQENFSPRLNRAQEVLDAGNPELALSLVQPILKSDPQNPVALLLRSTARLMQGDLEGGRRDLDQVLRLDPKSHQAWLNRAALDVSEERHEEALQAFRKARDLQPEMPENDLNVGAIELLLGQLQPASQSFKQYLTATPDSAQAYYLVARNYALAGYGALARQHLQAAIRVDERARVQARTDPNFSDLAKDLHFQQLLETDTFQPAPGSYLVSKRYETPYARGSGPLLPAVLDALQLSAVPFDSRVEVAQSWALIWAQMRIKIGEAEGGGSFVQMSAPASRFTPRDWQQQTESLYREISLRLAQRSMSGRGRNGR